MSTEKNQLKKIFFNFRDEPVPNNVDNSTIANETTTISLLQLNVQVKSLI